MSYGKQRIANRFADWTKIRQREDSNGQKIFDPFGKAIDNEIKNAVLLKSTLKLKSYDLESENFWFVNLEEGEEVEFDAELNSFNFPEVLDVESNITLERFSEWESFFKGVPDSYNLEYEKETIKNVWSEGVEVPVELKRAEHLGIVVKGSTEYFRNRSKTQNRKPFGGYYFVCVKGLDEDFQPIEEYVPVLDDGFYSTANTFRKVTSVEKDGFDGETYIFFGRRKGGVLYKEKFPFIIGANKEREGFIELELVKDEVSEEGFLISKLGKHSIGAIYRNNLGEDPEEIGYEEITEQLLLDENGATYEPVDFCIDYRNGRICVLDVDSRVHTYEYYLSSFISSVFEETEHTPIKLEVSKQRIGIGEEIQIKTTRFNSEVRINKVKLSMKKPDGSIVFLDKFGNESISETWISGIDHPFPLHSWKDFKFIKSFENAGQYDLNLEIESPRGTFKYNYSFICDYMNAEKSFSFANDNYTGIYISKENYLCLETDLVVKAFSEEKEGYFVDFKNQRLIFRKTYNDIEVIPT